MRCVEKGGTIKVYALLEEFLMLAKGIIETIVPYDTAAQSLEIQDISALIIPPAVAGKCHP